MPRRQDRVPVVFDTNVLVAHYLSRRTDSACSQLIRLWRERRLQLVLSDLLQTEYLEVLERSSVEEARVRQKFLASVNRLTASRRRARWAWMSRSAP